MDSEPSNDAAEKQFEDILSLVLARSRGEVENDDVEKALSSIVAAHAPSSVGLANGEGPDPPPRGQDLTWYNM